MMKHQLSPHRLLATAALLLACSWATAQTIVPTAFVSGTTTEPKEGAPMVADGFLYTKWCIDSRADLPYQVVLQAREGAVAIRAYSLFTADDTHSYPERNPITWTVEGSNDATNWNVIDQRRRYFRISDGNEQESRFEVKDAKPYKFYRFQFMQMVEGTRLQLSEIRLLK